MNTTLHIPLPTAYLCGDCSCIGNNSMRCPACASEVLMNLAGVLNRDSGGIDASVMASAGAFNAHATVR